PAPLLVSRGETPKWALRLWVSGLFAWVREGGITQGVAQSARVGTMGNELTLDELAELTAAPADQLREWRSLGLIGRESAETFGPEDVQRIRLIQLLLRRGIGLEAIARVEQEQGFLS